MRQWLAFVRKEFYHVFRDRRTLLILLFVLTRIDRDEATVVERARAGGEAV